MTIKKTVMPYFLFFGFWFCTSSNNIEKGNYQDTSNTLSDLYPNDVGIQQDSNVIFTEMFDDGLPNIFSRYTEVLNGAGMSISETDVPAGSKAKSIMMTSIGGKNDGGHLFKKLTPGLDGTVFLRYYVKYPITSKGYIHHESVRIGGQYPPVDYHVGQAGLCGLGDKRFSISYEPIGEPNMDAYVYWNDMRSWNGGASCYGNDLVNGSPTAQKLDWDEWMCIEMMVKLNNPVTAKNGELRIWQNGVEVGHWGPGFPNGEWKIDSWFNDAKGTPFEGFRWRTDAKLNINYLWIEYYDDTSPKDVEHHIRFSNIVMARKYIGPIKK